MAHKCLLCSMALILFFFSCKKKTEYESFQLKGKCIDWISNEPIAGITMELYAGYRGGMFSTGKSEMVGKATTGADGSYTIIPVRSEYLRRFSDSYLLLKITSSRSYVTGDSSIVVNIKDLNPGFSGVIHHDFKFGKTTILKVMVNSGPGVDTGTICRIDAQNYNTVLDWYTTRFLESEPYMYTDDFNGSRYFKGPVSDGFILFEVLAEDSCTVSGSKRTPPGIWEEAPVIRTFCPEGDTTIVTYTY